MSRAAFLLFTAVLPSALVLSGCGIGGETTVTVERTVTVGQASTTGSAAAEREAYLTQIDEIATQADGINRDFSILIDRFNAGETNAEEMSGRAEQNRLAFDDFSRRLTEMQVPPEFQQAHKQLISGFHKWQSAYLSYRDGFTQNSNELLEKANGLNDEAVIEVNQAINEIAQVR